MAELIAASTALGIASSLITFTDVAYRVLKRFNEYRERTENVPKVIRHITAQLPVIIERIECLKRDTKNGSLIAPKSALAVAVIGCDQEIIRMDAKASKLVPDVDDSKLRLVKKAALSVRYEKNISNSWEALQSYVATLTFHFTAMNAALPDPDQLHSKLSFTVPFDRDGDFVDRPTIMKQVEEDLSTRTRVALAGMGGAGKSQIAIEYAFRFTTQFPDRHVFWIHASNPKRFRQAYSDIARNHRIPGYNDVNADLMKCVCEWLTNGHRKWLLILDNADDMDTFYHSALNASGTSNDNTAPLVDYIPKGQNGSVLITTRDKRVGEALSNGTFTIKIEPMDHNDAQKMLQARIPDTEWNETDSSALIKELEYLPLAITQAAAFIRHNSISIKQYLKLLEVDDFDMKDLLSKELPDSRRDSSKQNSILRTWKLSFDQISTKDPYAAGILSLMAVVDRHSIPVLLLRENDKGAVEFTTAIGTLQAFSLIRMEKNGTEFELHRLVHLSMQNWLELKNDLTRWQQEAIIKLSRTFPFPEFENWRTCEALVPHATVALTYSPSSKFSWLQYATLLHNLQRFENATGHYGKSVIRGSKSVEITQGILGKDHINTLASMITLANSYYCQGNCIKAIAIHRDVLTTCKQVLGIEHRLTISAMYNLAKSCLTLGEYKEASILFSEVMETPEGVLGDEDPLTLKSMNGVASCLLGEGNYAKAANLHQQVLEIQKRVLGDEHPDTLDGIINLATCRSKQGNYAEAANLHQQVLEIQTRVLGDEHPWTLTSINNLAVCRSKQGNYAEAINLHQQVLEIQTRVLGDEHPDTLTNMNNLAICRSQQGNYAEAINLHQKVLEIQTRVLGDDHSETLQTIHCLGIYHNEQGDSVGAINLIKPMIEIRKRTSGEEHPSTLQSKQLLGACYGNIGDMEVAKDLLLHTFEIQKRVMGEQHPDTLKSMLHLAWVYGKERFYAKAVDLLEKVLAGEEICLGPNHPRYLGSKNLLKTIRRQMEEESGQSGG